MEERPYWLVYASLFLAVVFVLFFWSRAQAEEAPWWQRYAQKYNCAWVNHQLQHMTPEQLEAKARRWHVPEELIQLAKQCPR